MEEVSQSVGKRAREGRLEGQEECIRAGLEGKRECSQIKTKKI